MNDVAFVNLALLFLMQNIILRIALLPNLNFGGFIFKFESLDLCIDRASIINLSCNVPSLTFVRGSASEYKYQLQ